MCATFCRKAANCAIAPEDDEKSRALWAETAKTTLTPAVWASGSQFLISCSCAIDDGCAGFQTIETRFWASPTSWSVWKNWAAVAVVSLPRSSLTPTVSAGRALPARTSAAQAKAIRLVILVNVPPVRFDPPLGLHVGRRE